MMHPDRLFPCWLLAACGDRPTAPRRRTAPRVWSSRRSSRQAVAAGELPPVASAFRSTPAVVSFEGTDKEPGRYGGTLRLLGGSAKDTRLLVVYGYARLVGYTPDYDIVPDIAESVEVEEGRRFTFHLRPGHSWSDGEPFTSEDFRYYWEDIANDAEVSRFGPPKELLVDGEKPVVEFPDETTVRYSWSKPNPYFLPALAGAQPLEIFRPSHYLKQFHAKLCRPGGGREDGRGGGGAELGGAPLQQGPLLPERQPRLSDAAALGAEDASRPPTASSSSATPITTASTRTGQQLPYIDQVALTISELRADPGQGGGRRGRPAGRLSRLLQLHVPEAGGGAQQLPGPPLAGREGRARRALPEPERDRPGLARALPQRRFPPRAVGRDQPRGHQQRDLLRAGDARQQHRAAAIAALQGRVPDEVDAVRSGAGQPAARRARPDRAGRRRDPAPARRPAAADRRRDGGRGDRADRRAGADPRRLAEDRHRALHQAVAARGLLQPHQGRRDADVGVVGAWRTRCSSPR